MGSTEPIKPEWQNWSSFCSLVTDVLSSLEVEHVGALQQNDHLVHDLGLDSFGVLAFLDEFEYRLGIALPASLEEPTLGTMYRLSTSHMEPG